MDLDLREEAAALAPELGALPELDPAQRLAAIRTWKGRMRNEHASARVFAALLPQAMRAGLSARRQTQLAEMATDELRHGRQCAAVVHALGGQARASMPPLPDVPLHADVTPLEGLLRNAIAVCCLSETVAVALLSAERLELGPPALRRTLETILADEVQHARWGWTLLDELRSQIDEAMRERLTAYLQPALAHLLMFELAHLPPRTPQGADHVGVCEGQDGRTLLHETIETVIVPQLQAHGLDARKAWQHVQATALA